MKNSTLSFPLSVESFSTGFFLLIRCSSFRIISKIFIAGIFLIASHSRSLAQWQPGAPVNGMTQNTTPEQEAHVRRSLKESSRKLELVENNGQMGLPKKILAYFSSGNQIVFIEKACLRIVVLRTDEKNIQPETIRDKSAINPESKKFRYNSFAILFKGSSPLVTLLKKQPLETQRNFINVSLDQQRVTGVHSYGEIVLNGMYKGIDLRLYSGVNGQLEFDWIVAPGADASMIQMQFKGQKKLSILDQILYVKLEMGDFKLSLPESYYVTATGKQKADIRFAFRGKDQLAFAGFEKKNKKYPLVIDPDLLWGTYFDGGNVNFDEYLYGIQFDPVNNLLYCTGAANRQVDVAYAAAFSGAYNGTYNAVTDVIIYAFTKDGQTVQYITYLGGSDADVGVGLSVTSSKLFVCGYTSSTDFPVTKGSAGDIVGFDTTFHGGSEGFVAVFNLALSQLSYCSYLGGPGNEKALTVRAQSDSSYYISLTCGDTLSRLVTDYLVSSADSSFSGSTDAWIGSFSSMNQIRFGTYIGGNSSDLVNDFQVLSTGDVVFIGNTNGISEINGTVPNDVFGREALFGRINVPVAGPVSFAILEEIGGAGEDYGWGIYNLGDSVSVLVGETNSSDFPLGSGPAFQNTNKGNYDGFIARINNDGTGGYQASFVGGSDDDILVSVRSVVINNITVLLAFGTTKSNDLATINTAGGSFYSGSNSGGYDMMWVICNLNVTYKYYLSYIGGSSNDYLGKTGAPVGSNHLYFNLADSVIYLGTTTHSNQATQYPLFEGRGPGDLLNQGVPVFDSTKDNSNNDTHTIIAISIRQLFILLPVTWEKFMTSVLSDCSVQLNWQTENENGVKQYIVQRSVDGRNYSDIAKFSPVGNSYAYHDLQLPPGYSNLTYRISAENINGQRAYSEVDAVQLCELRHTGLRIYPTLAHDHLVISGLNVQAGEKYSVELFDVIGKKIMSQQLSNVSENTTFYFQHIPPRGSYFVVIRDSSHEGVLYTQKIAIGSY